MVNILFLSGRTFNQVTFYGWSFSPWRGFPWHIFRGGSFRGGSFRILKNMCTKYILQPRSFQVFIKGTNDNNGRFFGSLAMDLADIIWRCVHLGSSILLTTTACILYKIFENWVAKGETLCYGSKCWGKNMLPKRHKSMCGHHCLYFFVVYREST